MYLVCCCSLPVWRRSFCDLFWPRPGSVPGRIWPKKNNTCKGPCVLHPHQVSSKSIKGFWRRSWNVKSLRRTDGRTTHYDNSSLEPSAKVSLKVKWQHKNATKNLEYTMIADRLRTVSLLTIATKRVWLKRLTGSQPFDSLQQLCGAQSRRYYFS